MKKFRHQLNVYCAFAIVGMVLAYPALASMAPYAA